MNLDEMQKFLNEVNDSKDYVLLDEYTQILCMTPPQQITQPPIMFAKPELVKKFYTNLVNQYYDVTRINGYTTELFVETVRGVEMAPWQCDYCNQLIDMSKSYYYCLSEHKDMCPDCFKQIGDSKNFVEPRNLTKWKQVRNLMNCCCDLCHDDFDESILENFDKEHVILTNRLTDHDLCQKCADTPEGRDRVLQQNLEEFRFTPSKMIGHREFFGSLLDWCPVYFKIPDSDSESDFHFSAVLYNWNPKSKYHGQYGLAKAYGDDRYRFYRLPPDHGYDQAVKLITQC